MKIKTRKLLIHILWFILLVGAPVGAQQAKKPTFSRQGVIYERLNPSTGKIYIGQANSQKRYETRQGEHTNKNGVNYKFRVLERPYRADLDFREEARLREAIQKQGAKNVENKRVQMNEKRFQEEAKRRTQETASQRRERRDAFDTRRYERGRQATRRRSERLEHSRKVQERLERMRQSTRRNRGRR
jgi:hypothetical protein